MKTAKEIMESLNLTGPILEPAPYYYERVERAMQEYAELIAFDFQRFRKNRLGFAFTDERLKAEFEEYKKEHKI